MEKQEEILNDQIGGTLNTKESTELIQREQLPETPFTLITTEGKSFITLGRYKLTEDHEDKEEAACIPYDFNWNFIINVMNALIIDATQEIQTTQRQNAIDIATLFNNKTNK